MNTALRSIALTIGASAFLAACGSSSKSVADVLAEDSTLAREVMSAQGDTLAQPIETANPDTAMNVTAGETVVARSQPGPADTPLTVSSSIRETERSVFRPDSRISKTAVASNSSSGRSIARSSRSSRVVQRRSNEATAPASRTATSANRQRRIAETTPMRGTATIPAGIELALASDQRICASMSRVGDTFAAHVAEDVVGPIGVVIPKGAIAHARVVANKRDVDIDIESLSFADRDYSLESLVTYAEMEKIGYKTRRTTRNAATGAGLGAVVGGVAGHDIKSAMIGAAGGAVAGILASRSTGSTRRDQCIPAGGEIIARLVSPLRIALGD